VKTKTSSRCSRCSTCEKVFDLIPFRNLDGSVLVIRTNPCLNSGGVLLDYCTQECWNKKLQKADCGVCKKHYAFDDHRKNGCNGR